MNFLRGSGINYLMIKGDKFFRAQEIAKNANIIKLEVPIIAIEDYKPLLVDSTSLSAPKQNDRNNTSNSLYTDSAQNTGRVLLKSYMDNLHNTYYKNMTRSNKNYNTLKTNINRETVRGKLLSKKIACEKRVQRLIIYK